jgi:hypothetical protein
LASFQCEDFAERLLPAPRGGIWTLCRNRVEGIGEGEHAGALRNLLFDKAVRVPASVPAFVMRTDDVNALRFQQGNVLEDLYADQGMLLHELARSCSLSGPGLFRIGSEIAILLMSWSKKPCSRLGSASRLGSLDDVSSRAKACNSHCMKARVPIFGFKRLSERTSGLPVGLLQKQALGPFDLQQTAQVTGIREEAAQRLVHGYGPRTHGRNLSAARADQRPRAG